MSKLLTPSVVGIRSDGRAFKPRVAESYIYYFKMALKDLNLDNESFFKIKNIETLKKIKEELLTNRSFKKRKKETQYHLSSTFGKYIKYVSNLRMVEKNAKSHIKQLTENYFKLGFEKDKQGLCAFIKLLSFIDNPSAKPPIFKRIIGKYLGIKDEKEFNRFCLVVSKFQDDQYYEIVATDSEMTSTLLAITAHLEFLKSKV